MPVNKRLWIVMAGVVLASGCYESSPSDETSSIVQGLIPIQQQTNNQILQSSVMTNNSSRHMRGLKRTAINSTTGVESWSLVAETDSVNVPATLYFTTSWSWTGYSVKTLATNQGFLVVTYFNSGTSGATTTKTLNSGNSSGDSLVVKVAANASFGNITWIKFSSYQVSGTSHSLYKAVMSTSAGTPGSTAGDGALVNENQFTLCSDGLCTMSCEGGTCRTTVTENYMLPIGGYKWDATNGNRVADADFISWGSDTDALGSCVIWGAPPWGANASENVSCTRAKRADICGDGRTWTTPKERPPQNVWFLDHDACVPVQSCDKYRRCQMIIPPPCVSKLEGWYGSAGADCFNPQNWRGKIFGSAPQDPNGNVFNPATSCPGRTVPTTCAGSGYAVAIGLYGQGW